MNAFDARASDRPRSGLADVLADQRVIVAFAVATLWAGIVILSVPAGLPIQTGLEAWCYWSASLLDPYARSTWTAPGAYVYSPAFLQAIAPLTALAWPVFVAVWTGILLLAARILTGPRWFALGVALVSIELLGGNISLLLALAIVAGFRWPAAWAFVLLTKITPGVGLLWFVVRGEWRSLFVALGATAGIVTASALVMPTAWLDWIGVLTASVGTNGTWASVPVPLAVRMPMAIVLVIWGARTDRRWTVPVASMLALPALWYGSLSMLLAIIPLWRHQSDAAAAERTANEGQPGTQAAAASRPD